MQQTIPSSMEPYHALIDEHLERRSRSSTAFDLDPEHQESRYAVDMCRALADLAARRSGRAVELSTMLQALRLASGHVDFHRKFALYASEIERGDSFWQ